MQLLVTGFLSKKAPAFMEELWSLLVSAQENVAGIPQVMSLLLLQCGLGRFNQRAFLVQAFLDAKREEMERKVG